MPKNLGVVKWFGGGNKNYGFITFLSSNDNSGDKKEIFFHREGTKPATVIHNGEMLTVYPHEGKLVSFDIVDTSKGLKAVNVTVLNAQALANETDFADEAGCRNFLEKLLSAKIGEKFLSEFIAAAPEENLRKHSWLREKLSRKKHIELCLEMYAETPAPELEIEMTEILSGISTKMKFQIPPELAVKDVFREHSDMESRRAAVEKYFDTMTPEKIFDLTVDFSPEEIIDAIKDKATFGEKLPAFVKVCVAKTSKLDEWAKIIFAHDLPLEIILPRLYALNRETKLTAVEKYFDTMPPEEISDWTVDFSPEKIIDAIKDKATFDEKLPALVKVCVAKTSKLDDWAKIIFAHDLPLEIILPRLYALNRETKLTAVEKYFDTMTPEEISDWTKNFSPEEIIDAIKDKATFDEKFPALVKLCVAKTFKLDEWTKFIFAHNLPLENILPRFYALSPEIKLTAVEKYFDTLTPEEISDLTKDFSPEKIIDAIKDKATFGEKFPAFVKVCVAKTSKLDEWTKFIFAHNLPLENILPRLKELNRETKLAAVEKYFDTLTPEEISDWTKNFPPEEIIGALKDKATFGEKLPALVKLYVAQTYNLNEWAKFIFAHDLPLENILPRLKELNSETKLAVVEKYFDTMTPEKIPDLTADFSPEEIIDAIKDKATFGEKLPVIIEKSRNKFSWACYLVDNVDLFRQTKLGEDVLIFFMYKSVNRCNGKLSNLGALIKLLNEKIDDIEAAPRAKIVYSYICAAFAKHYAKRQDNIGDIGKCNEYLRKRDKFINDADETFTEIFNLLVGRIKTNAENPDETNADEIFKDFFEHEAQLLPQCSESDDDENCVFCEAITWNKKVVGDDGKERFDLQSWCPHSGKPKFCSRLFPKLNLPVKDWSVVELMAKLHLRPYEDRPENHKFNLEFFTRLGGEFNRIKDLLERLKCRKCGKYMRTVKKYVKCGEYMRAVNKYAKWKEITNIRRTASGNHFAIFAATTFSCQNDTCSEKGKPVYLSYCWCCGELIDSRDNHVRIRGFYLCNKCGAGYKDYVGDEHYTIFPGEICPSCTKCPKCGSQDFDITETFQLQCKKCGHVMNAPLKIKYTSKHDTHRKGECSCGHKLEWEIKPFWQNLEPVPWQKNFPR